MENYSSSDESSNYGFGMELEYPAFFKIYLPEHNSITLYIPPPFIQHLNENIPETISLKNVFGSVWPAKLKYIDNKLHIVDGWELYAKDHKLIGAEFVVFKYVSNSTFIVTAYDSDGMLKDEPEEKPTPETAIVNVSFADIAASNAILAGNMRFYKTFRNKFKNHVGVPKYIIDGCGVMELPQTVKLMNEDGRGINIKLLKLKDRVILGYKGLAKFWRNNGVEHGDKIEFEVICEHEGRIKQIIMTKTIAFGSGY